MLADKPKLMSAIWLIKLFRQSEDCFQSSFTNTNNTPGYETVNTRNTCEVSHLPPFSLGFKKYYSPLEAFHTALCGSTVFWYKCPQSSSVFVCHLISMSGGSCTLTSSSLENDGQEPEWSSFVSLSVGRENVKLMFCVAVKDKRTHHCLVTLWFKENVCKNLFILFIFTRILIFFFFFKP